MYRRVVLAASLAGVLALSACSGGDPLDAGASGSASPAGDLQQLTVGIPAGYAATAPIRLGVEKGCFADEGLELTFESAPTPSALATLISQGEWAIGAPDIGTVVQATSQGVPLKIIHPGWIAGDDPDASDGIGGIVVKADSPIQTIADLAGTTIAASGVNDITAATIKEALRKAGADPDSVTLVSVPTPNVIGTVISGDAAAGAASEPGITQGVADGTLRFLFNQRVAGGAPGFPNGPLVSSEKWIEENPEAAAGFVRGVQCSVDYAREHPEELRDFILTFTEIDPALVQEMPLANWGDAVTDDSFVDGVDRVIELMAGLGLISGEMPAEDIMWAPGD